MKKLILILFTLFLTLTLTLPAHVEYLPINLLDTLYAPSCAIKTDSGALVVTDVFNNSSGRWKTAKPLCWPELRAS